MRKEKKEGNLFDKILKENAEDIFMPLIARRLKIKIISSKPLPEKLQTTIEREVDLLRLVKTSTGEEMIIHLEFQAQNDKEMIYRFSEYHGIELRKYKIKIKHFLVFLGNKKPKMRLQLKEEEIFKEVELINIHEFKSSDFLSSQIPSEILLAILGDFKKDQAEAIIRLIIKKLKATSKSKSDLRKFIKQLTVLSRLRNLDVQTKKIVTTMPITYDITKDSFYLEGVEKEKISIIKNMLKRNFDIKTIAEVTDVTQKFVKQIQTSIKK